MGIVDGKQKFVGVSKCETEERETIIIFILTCAQEA